tara:strand:+ start:402 stop:584 length:183 start_codon:yes stop_codon:yes gene_type:complete
MEEDVFCLELEVLVPEYDVVLPRVFGLVSSEVFVFVLLLVMVFEFVFVLVLVDAFNVYNV